MADGRILWEGEVVEVGDGPVRCSWRDGDGLCNGFLGAPPAGSLLERVEPPGFRIEACQVGQTSLHCRSCGAVAVFVAPELAAVSGMG